ncbi:OsmC family protein [Actinoplanes sp. GCM10030250]|uniref:OsmC family protein n=1 Tax=Actinoplanes sp. GCM10030250 TaxID=3273376 RepID=UPI00360BD708
MSRFEVVAGAGSLRSREAGVTRFPHRWTEEGVTVEAEFTGAHLLHLSVAGCVLNDVYREAQDLGIKIDGVRVSAGGGFDSRTWASDGVTYEVEVSSPAPGPDVAALLRRVDEVAEIPRAIRAGASVDRSGNGVDG